MVSSDNKDYYYGHTGETKLPVDDQGPTASFRFLNRAAMKTEGDTEQEGKLTESWSLCTVQQVEDLKTLLRIFPLWSTSIFLSIPIGIQSSLMVLQALSMDRHLGRHVNIPAGSFIVATFLATVFSLSVIDRVFFPAWKTLTRQSMTPLQRIGVGHVLNILGMAGSALVESRRLKVAKSHNLTHQLGSIVPMSAFWLVTPLAIVGIGEAFHFPGQVALYYQEFPTSLKSTATAMIALLVAAGFYLSTALIDLFQRVTGWLPDNINEGRIDNVFWVLVVIGAINFGYYITCAMLYRYKNVENAEEKSER
ncbi:NRT1/ PTR FAMILY 2.6 [Thalictrum thalictroides]|uniref:NRT1/ PTR FAMILY 2.6 n=1 Tax=Thalictrum thalictroides TaxID=46969 RepID=A0A7J6WMW4_THATH|nr:NRT1/ PTR FAMILY 2.6 [Thalictrum thalictroides]